MPTCDCDWEPGQVGHDRKCPVIVNRKRPRGEPAPGYHCRECGATGCKLWRVAASSCIRLWCLACAEEVSNDRLKFGAESSDQLYNDGLNLVPAVPTEDGEDWWGYTSVPDDRCAWWRALPTAPAQAKEGSLDNHKIEPRTSVQRFAEQMELALRRNSHKDGWSRCSSRYLFRRMREEIEELSRAKPQTIAKVQEAADVANFAMMIADKNWPATLDNVCMCEECQRDVEAS